MGPDRRRAVVAAALALATLGGCASDPGRNQEVLDWLLWNEAEKKRLDDAGFPQYNEPG